jgi:transcriptional regulator GlxA family with amidase domain
VWACASARTRGGTTRRLALGGEASAPQQLLAAHPDVTSVATAVVEDGGVLTGGGVALAIDAMLRLIARFYGEEACGEVARALEYDRALAANRAQLGYA